MNINPTNVLAALVIDQMSSKSSAVIEKDGNYFFKNAEAAATARMLIQSANRGKSVKFIEETSKEKTSDLGIRLKSFTLGWHKHTSQTRKVSLEAEFYEASPAQQFLEFYNKVNDKGASLLTITQAFKAVSVMTQNNAVGYIGSEKEKAAQEPTMLLMADE